MAEDFVPESLRDTDQLVLDRFNEGGGYEETWKEYNDGLHTNPFSSYKDMVKRLCIVSCDNTGTIRSGRAFSSMGSEYDYEPLFKVLWILKI